MQNNMYTIEGIFESISEEQEITLLNKIARYYMQILRKISELEKLDENQVFIAYKDKWKNIKRWFVGSDNRVSDIKQLSAQTNEIIRKITMYAVQLADYLIGECAVMRFFKKKDVIAIVILLVMALVGLFLVIQFNSKAEKKALVYYDNQQILEIDLIEGVDKFIEIPGHERVVLHQFADGAIAFELSDCPDKVCVNTGKLKFSGLSAACLPNKIVVKIVDKGNEQNYDIIIR